MRVWRVAVAALLAAPALGADVGLGLVLAGDSATPGQANVASLFSRQAIPGVLVFVRDHSWGLSFDYSFNWYDDALGSWFDFDFRGSYDLHLLAAGTFDPFLQVGVALQMRTPLEERSRPGTATDLGFRAVAGAGINLVGQGLYLRGAVQYQGIGVGVPTLAVPEAGAFRVMLSAGTVFD